MVNLLLGVVALLVLAVGGAVLGWRLSLRALGRAEATQQIWDGEDSRRREQRRGAR